MSIWHVIIAPAARKNVTKIPEPDKSRILKALEELHFGLAGDITPLVGRYEWRLRVGKWRILLDVNVQDKIITVLFIASRGDVYKK